MVLHSIQSFACSTYWNIQPQLRQSPLLLLWQLLPWLFPTSWTQPWPNGWNVQPGSLCDCSLSAFFLPLYSRGCNSNPRFFPAAPNNFKYISSLKIIEDLFQWGGAPPVTLLVSLALHSLEDCPAWLAKVECNLKKPSVPAHTRM